MIEERSMLHLLKRIGLSLERTDTHDSSFGVNGFERTLGSYFIRNLKGKVSKVEYFFINE